MNSQLIQRVLKDSGYRNQAQYFRRVIAETDGLDLAADLIERALLTRADVAHLNAKWPRRFRAISERICTPER